MFDERMAFARRVELVLDKSTKGATWTLARPSDHRNKVSLDFISMPITFTHGRTTKEFTLVVGDIHCHAPLSADLMYTTEEGDREIACTFTPGEKFTKEHKEQLYYALTGRFPE